MKSLKYDNIKNRFSRDISGNLVNASRCYLAIGVALLLTGCDEKPSADTTQISKTNVSVAETEAKRREAIVERKKDFDKEKAEYIANLQSYFTNNQKHKVRWFGSGETFDTLIFTKDLKLSVATNGMDIYIYTEGIIHFTNRLVKTEVNGEKYESNEWSVSLGAQITASPTDSISGPAADFEGGAYMYQFLQPGNSQSTRSLLGLSGIHNLDFSLNFGFVDFKDLPGPVPASYGFYLEPMGSDTNPAHLMPAYLSFVTNKAFQDRLQKH